MGHAVGKRDEPRRGTGHELLSTALSALVDRAEVGKPTGARVRLALQVDDLVATAARLTALGPTVWAGRW